MSEENASDLATPETAPVAEKPRANKRLRAVGLALVGVTVLGAIVFDSYGIPAGSMAPTLQTEDHIVTNAFAYGFPIPFTDGRIGASPPARGDVVVFRYPLDESEDFIKRVIALPGDELRMEGQRLLLKRAGEEELEELAREPTGEPCRGRHDEHPRCEEFRETLDGKTYLVQYMRPFDDAPQYSRTFVVPPDHFFVLGDNRNQSHDSAQWFVELPDGTAEPRPFVPFANLKSRAAMIWFPPDRIGTDIE